MELLSSTTAAALLFAGTTTAALYNTSSLNHTCILSRSTNNSSPQAAEF